MTTTESPAPSATLRARSVSIFRKRIQKFKRIKRGYYSFLILVIAYVISFALPILINNKALIVQLQGRVATFRLRGTIRLRRSA